MARKPPPVPPKGKRPPNAGKGRPKGVPNKVTSEIRVLAGKYGPDAIQAMAIMAGLAPPVKRLPNVKEATTEAVKKAATDSILDRAYGKPTQPLQHSADESFESLLDRLGRG